MKKIIVLLGLMLCAVAAKAQPLVNATSVKIIVPYHTSCSSMTFSATPTEVTGNTQISSTTAGIYDLTVYTTAAIAVFCSDNPAVTSSGANIGAPLAGYAGGTALYPSIHFVISPMEKFYCVGASGGATVVVCKQR